MTSSSSTHGERPVSRSAGTAAQAHSGSEPGSFTVSHTMARAVGVTGLEYQTLHNGATVARLPGVASAATSASSTAPKPRARAAVARRGTGEPPELDGWIAAVLDREAATTLAHSPVGAAA